MKSSGNTLQILVSLARKEKSGVYLRLGCGSEQIKTLQLSAREKLHMEIPADYIQFLQCSNGAQIDNAYFKEAENLVLENLDLARPGILTLGNAGNVDEYIYDSRDERFHIVNMGFPDERHRSFQEFGDLLLAIMMQQGVIPAS
jgi:hypothetical protein